MERLTERLNNLKRGVSQMDDKEEIKVNKNFLKYVCEYIEQLKSYKDAEEQGLFLRLPCKVGDTVYSVVKDGLQIFELKFSLDFYVRRMSDFGKTVFLTKEEAEQALAEMKEE